MSVINKMLHDLAKRQAEQQTEPSRSLTAPSSSQPLTQEGLTRPLSTRRKWLLALSILIAVLLSYSALQGGADFSPLLTPTATTPVTSVAADPAETSIALTTTSEAVITATIMPAESDVPELSESELPASSSMLALSSAPQSVSHLAKAAAEIAPASSTIMLAEPNPASANELAQLHIETLPQQKWAQQMEQAATAIAQQRWEEALYLLETDAAVADYPPLFALKAAVLQQLQQWSAALALYQQLLLQEPQQASWNLSAGIAAQQLQQTALATQYFQVAWQGRQQLSQASQQFLQQQLNPMN